MRFKQLIGSVGLGLGLILIFLVGMASADDPDHHKNHHLSSTTPPPLSGAANESIRETNLTPGGDIYEVNPDAQGNLWLSEYGADQIWQFNRGTSAYTIYNGLLGSDARRDNNNNVWWAGYDNGLLGRINLTASTVTTWTLPGAVRPWGVAIDTSGLIWVTDSDAPHIYRFNLTSTQVCSYTVPDSGASMYIVHDAGNLWIGDDDNNRLVKLDPAANQFTYWQLPFYYSDPVGLAVDSSGNLWWAENEFAALGRLEPATSRVTTYTLPVGGWAYMVTISGGAIWYTAKDTFGVMNPATAVGSSATLTSATVAVTPNCAVLGAGVTSTPVISTGVAVFTSGIFTPTVNSGGWTVYQLPSDSSLWGIANAGGVWIGDRGRDKLVWFSYPIYLPMVLK